jgi:predicted permease
MGEIWRQLQYLLRRRRIQRELEEEMAAHRAAMGDPRGFGSPLKIREDSNEVWGFGWLDRLWQDLQFASRILRRSPGFTLTAVAVLALGIGLNVTAFGFLNTAMFRPLPGIRDPHTLMRLTRKSPESSSTNVSYPALDFYRRNNKVFTSMLGTSGAELAYAESERWKAQFVTRNFFSELGAGAAYGHLFHPGAGEPGDVVLSDAFFQRRFGGDVSIVGKPMLLNRKAAKVVGVVGADFQGLDPIGTDVWAVIEDHPHFFEDSTLLSNSTIQPLQLYGRLAAGVSPDIAREAMRPVVNARREIAPQEIWKDEFLHVEPGAYVLHGNHSRLVGPLLLAGTLLLLVLATACANLGNLLLARGVTREREISIRTSVGASRARIVRQLMTESAALALLGAFAALVLSAIVTNAMVKALDWPSYVSAAPDWRVVAFAFGSALLASIFFGFAPALQATRTNAPRAARLRLILIGTQAAASCTLLILSGLLTRGLQNATLAAPGFSFEQSAIIDPNLYGVGREGRSARLYFEELRSRIERVAKVEATALATIPPLGQRNSVRVHPIGRLQVNGIEGSYFETMQIPLLRGRTFRAGDRDVTILSGRAASRMWPNEDPLSKEYVSRDGKSRWEVVGIAANASIDSPGDPDGLEIYFPIQESEMQSAVLLVRTSDLNAIHNTLRRTANGVDSRVIPTVEPMRDGMQRRLNNSRSGAMAVSMLGAVSLLLSVVGFAGLISFAVTQRTREIGIRLALGATRWQVIRIGLDRLLLPTGAGLAVGMLAGAGLAYLLRSQLYGLSNLDPVSFAMAPLLFLAAALAFSMGPLSRAARVDPAIALRHD